MAPLLPSSRGVRQANPDRPLYQVRKYFEALAARSKTTRMVTCPGYGRFPAPWGQRHDLFREIAAWLIKYNPRSAARVSNDEAADRSPTMRRD